MLNSPDVDAGVDENLVAAVVQMRVSLLKDWLKWNYSLREKGVGETGTLKVKPSQ